MKWKRSKKSTSPTASSVRETTNKITEEPREMVKIGKMKKEGN